MRLSGARHHQRGAEHQEADHSVGKGLDRNAEQAFARQHVIGSRLFERRFGAAERSQPFRVGEQRIYRKRQHAEQQAPATRAPQRLHQDRPHDGASHDHVGRRSAEFPAGLRRLADGAHQENCAGESRDEQQDIIPGNPVERRVPGSRKDQERERQHQRDQQVEILGVELRIADEEAQRELLVDAQQDGDRGRDHQGPAPAAAQRTHARDFGFLHVGMRVVELNPLRRRSDSIAR
ncbi:conserved hypothetical protein [Ricinus communis]|uniref:Uncharacterized protein n=1 Tax=Ricinus communis TaxID=3988 RepID=B9TN24_RICCO|nr:conserved hypothetical protein [Ricinus communis]